MFETNYLSLLVVRTVVPLVMVIVLILSGRRALRRGHAATGHMLFNGGVLLVFLLYPNITQTVFKFFQVKPFDGNYGTYMMADYAVDANGAAYQNMVPFAVAAIGIWPVGVPLVIAGLLWRARAPLLEIQRRGALRPRVRPEAWRSTCRSRGCSRASRRTPTRTSATSKSSCRGLPVGVDGGVPRHRLLL